MGRRWDDIVRWCVVRGDIHRSFHVLFARPQGTFRLGVLYFDGALFLDWYSHRRETGPITLLGEIQKEQSRIGPVRWPGCLNIIKQEAMSPECLIERLPTCLA